jgi:hypothetical protein
VRNLERASGRVSGYGAVSGDTLLAGVAPSLSALRVLSELGSKTGPLTHAVLLATEIFKGVAAYYDAWKALSHAKCLNYSRLLRDRFCELLFFCAKPEDQYLKIVPAMPKEMIEQRDASFGFTLDTRKSLKALLLAKCLILWLPE